MLPTEETLNYLADSMRMLAEALKGSPGMVQPTPEIQRGFMGIQTTVPHKSYIDGWKRAMAAGLIGGRAFSTNTINIYTGYITSFLERFELICVDSIKLELLNIPAEMFGKRDKEFKALVCFSKYLVAEGALPKGFLEDLKPYRPKRHLPPKQMTIKDNQFQKLLEAAETLQDKAILMVLAGTGIRVGECADLKVRDIDLNTGKLEIRASKWGKSRGIGLPKEVKELLAQHLQTRPKDKDTYVFAFKGNTRVNRHGIRKRLLLLGKKVDVIITPHALRRFFITTAAAQGKPLAFVRRAVGHTTLRMTEQYIKLDDSDTIRAMQDW